MLSFINRNLWGCSFGIAFLCCLVACFSVPSPYFWWAMIGACGTGLSSLYCFVHKPPLKPFDKTYYDGDWEFAADDMLCPRLYIPSTEHGMGKTPDVEIRPKIFDFPPKIDSDGNIIIKRTNFSVGKFAPMRVIVRQSL